MENIKYELNIINNIVYKPIKIKKLFGDEKIIIYKWSLYKRYDDETIYTIYIYKLEDILNNDYNSSYEYFNLKFEYSNSIKIFLIGGSKYLDITNKIWVFLRKQKMNFLEKYIH